MKHLCNAIGIEGSELEKVIEGCIEKEAMEIIPKVSAIVKETLQEVISSKVRAYFDFGKGRKAIDKAIEEAIKIKDK